MRGMKVSLGRSMPSPRRMSRPWPPAASSGGVIRAAAASSRNWPQRAPARWSACASRRMPATITCRSASALAIPRGFRPPARTISGPSIVGMSAVRNARPYCSEPTASWASAITASIFASPCIASDGRFSLTHSTWRFVAVFVLSFPGIGSNVRIRTIWTKHTATSFTLPTVTTD